MLAKDYEKIHEQRESEEINRNRRRKKVKKKSNGKLGSLGIILLFLGVSLLLLSRYAAITSIRTDITKLERNIEDLEKKKVNLQAKLEGIKSSEKIEEEATLKLGMDYPNDGQLVYLSVGKTETKAEDFSYIVKENFNKLISGVEIFFRR